MKSFFKTIRELYYDAKNIYQKDPAAKNVLSIILLYPGFHILVSHRICHFLYRKKYILFLDLYHSYLDFLLVLKYIQEPLLVIGYL